MVGDPNDLRTFTSFKFTQPKPPEPSQPPPPSPPVTAIQVGLHKQHVAGDQAYWWPGGTPDRGPTGQAVVDCPDPSPDQEALINLPNPPTDPNSDSANVKVNNIWIAYQLEGSNTWHQSKSFATPEAQGGVPAFCFTSVTLNYDPPSGQWTGTFEVANIDS